MDLGCLSHSEPEAEEAGEFSLLETSLPVFFSKFKQIDEAVYGEVYISAKCVLIKGRL